MASLLSSLKKTNGSAEEILATVVTTISETNWIEITSKKEIQKISTFLCQINHMEALRALLVKCFKQTDKIPGDALFYFISKNSNINITQSVFAKLDQEYSFFKIYACPYHLAKELYADQIVKQRNIYLQRYNKTKEDLIDKLQFARTQRLEAEVKKTLEKLIEAFPEDPNFVKEKGLYFEKEAARVIEKNSKKISEKHKYSSNIPQYTPLFNAEEVYHVIMNEFKGENLVYLLEIFLMAGEDEIAIKIISQNNELKIKYFWNFIELLIVKQRYLEALAQIKEMKEIKRTEDEFNYYYFTAICLWYLNDKQTALDTMRSIAKVKPHFKQTQIYLNLWQHHDEVA